MVSLLRWAPEQLHHVAFNLDFVTLALTYTIGSCGLIYIYIFFSFYLPTTPLLYLKYFMWRNLIWAQLFSIMEAKHDKKEDF